MGYTYAKSIQMANIPPSVEISILETYPSRIEELRKEGLFKIHDRPNTCIPNASIILLAVKPQHSNELFESIKEYMDNDHLVISIMAGVKISTIQDSLGINKIVRAMPNLPARIRLGMTSFFCSEEINPQERRVVQDILNSTGAAISLDSEDAIDATTAISGSGPAYVFYFMQSMIKAAEKIGFSDEQSRLLVSQTFDGAVQLFNQSDLSTEEWISRVASKGGTTRAALDSFEKNKVGEKIIEAAIAAYERAVELGRE